VISNNIDRFQRITLQVVEFLFDHLSLPIRSPHVTIAIGPHRMSHKSSVVSGGEMTHHFSD
jgi:hypothetical protein